MKESITAKTKHLEQVKRPQNFDSQSPKENLTKDILLLLPGAIHCYGLIPFLQGDSVAKLKLTGIATLFEQGPSTEPTQKPDKKGLSDIEQFIQKRVIAQLHLEGKRTPFSIRKEPLKVDYQLSQPFHSDNCQVMSVPPDLYRHCSELKALAFSQNGNYFVVVTNNFLRLWEHSDDGLQSLLYSSSIISHYAKHPYHEQLLVTFNTNFGYYPDAVSVDQVVDSHQLNYSLLERGGIPFVEFTKDGRTALVRDEVGYAGVFKQNNDGQWVCKMRVSGHERISTLDASSNGDRVITGGFDGAIRLWQKNGDIMKWSSCTTISRRPRQVDEVSFINNDRQILSFHKRQQSLRIWSQSDNGWTSRRLTRVVASISVSPRKTNFTCDKSGQLIGWALDTTHHWQSTPLDADVASYKYSPDGNHLISVNTESRVTLSRVGEDGHWEQMTLYEQSSPSNVAACYDYFFRNKASNHILSVADNARHIVVALRNNEVLFLERQIDFSLQENPNEFNMTAEDKDLWTITRLTGHRTPVNMAALSPDRCSLATGSEDGDIRLWQRG